VRVVPAWPTPSTLFTYLPSPNQKQLTTDDKMLMVWDLRPNVDIPSAPQSQSRSRSHSRSRSLSPPSSSSTSTPGGGSGGSTRPQPTAYVISFPHALSSVCAHASTTKELLVADVRGSLALVDWRSDPLHAPADAAWHHPRVIEFAAPRAVAGGAGAYPASAAWQQANPDMYVSSLPLPSPPSLAGFLFFSNQRPPLTPSRLFFFFSGLLAHVVLAPYIVLAFPSGISPSCTVASQR
jgi:hypothetical protein